MGEGERAPAWSPRLHEPKATSGARMEHGGHASEQVVLDILPLPIVLNGETEKRDEIEPERIFVWWVKYVDTMRPRSV
jgi:hypothetical protein